MPKDTKRIDVHHHITPEFYVEQLRGIGITESYGHAFPKWSPESSLSFMKKVGIETAIMSISTPGIYFEDRQLSRDLARSCNEYMADVKTEHPGRFGGFASIPLPDESGAKTELEHALDKLELDGVCLMTNYEGTYLGDDSFEAVFEELDRRGCIVFIHPTDPVGVYDPKLGIANALIEAPFETTRAVTNLIYTGVVDRYPNIKYILSHGGGTIPFLAWKIGLIKYGQKGKKPPFLKSMYDFLVKGEPDAGLKILKRMYYDTALSCGTSTMRTLREFPGPARVVFGSDFCFAKLAPIVTKNLDKQVIFQDDELRMINRSNCLELFPQFNGTR